jgi:hypothetical protein
MTFLRYTISEAARREVLARLLALNHQRYEEEVKVGLHEKGGKSKEGRKKTSDKKQESKKAKGRKGKKAGTEQLGLL